MTTKNMERRELDPRIPIEKQTETLLAVLTSCELFKLFSVEQLRDIIPKLNLEVRYIKAGTTIINSGEKNQYLGLVLSGTMAKYRSKVGKHERSLAQYKINSVFGIEYAFSDSGKSHADIVARTDCSVLFFSLQSIMTDERYRGTLIKAALQMMVDNAEHKTLRLDLLLEASLRQRIIIYLQAVRDECGKETFKIPLTQSAMAEYLGVNRSALSRELSRMRQEGIIEMTPDKRYRILKEPLDTQTMKQDERKTNKEDYSQL